MKFFNLCFAVIFSALLGLDAHSAGLSDSTLPATPVATSVVPADYNPEKHILLVMELHRRHNVNKKHKLATRALEKSLRTHFTYKYEIVSPKVMDTSSKYSDTSVYKYALFNELKFVTYDRSPTMMANGKMSPGGKMVRTFVDFHFYDRISKYNYPATGHSSTIVDQVIAPLSDQVRKEVYKEKV